MNDQTHGYAETKTNIGEMGKEPRKIWNGSTLSSIHDADGATQVLAFAMHAMAGMAAERSANLEIFCCVPSGRFRFGFRSAKFGHTTGFRWLPGRSIRRRFPFLRFLLKSGKVACRDRKEWRS